MRPCKNRVHQERELSRNAASPSYILTVLHREEAVFYKVDAKNGSIIEGVPLHSSGGREEKSHWMMPVLAKRVTFTEETLVAGGIKSPYYYPSPLKATPLAGLTKSTLFWA